MLADYDLAVATHDIWLYDHDGVVQAVLELIPSETHLLIENVAVHPTVQGRGLGRQLLLFAEETARRHGFTEVRLYTNERFIENLAIYSKLGYREFCREVIGTGQAVHMSKRIPTLHDSSDDA
jgi:GNAT superfamily N-acetyltransferase